MTHQEIFKKFMDVYPIRADEIECWYPNGKGSVRIKLREDNECNVWLRTDLVFTYSAKKIWKIETVDSYLDSIKMEVK